MADIQPYILLQPIEIPGWGQVPYGEIKDAATEAEYELAVHGAARAARLLADLDEMVARKTWRSPAAFDVMQRILRELSLQPAAEAAPAGAGAGR